MQINRELFRRSINLLTIGGLISIAVSCVGLPVSLVGPSSHLNRQALLFHWSVYPLNKQYWNMENVSTFEPSWCLGYGLSGLDGGHTGILCGFNRGAEKFVYHIPNEYLSGCTSRKNKRGDCKMMLQSSTDISLKAIQKPSWHSSDYFLSQVPAMKLSDNWLFYRLLYGTSVASRIYQFFAGLILDLIFWLGLAFFPLLIMKSLMGIRRRLIRNAKKGNKI